MMEAVAVIEVMAEPGASQKHPRICGCPLGAFSEVPHRSRGRSILTLARAVVCQGQSLHGLKCSCALVVAVL